MGRCYAWHESWFAAEAERTLHDAIWVLGPDGGRELYEKRVSTRGGTTGRRASLMILRRTICGDQQMDVGARRRHLHLTSSICVATMLAYKLQSPRSGLSRGAAQRVSIFGASRLGTTRPACYTARGQRGTT